MASVIAFLKLIYEHKEKVVLGILVIAFAGVGYYQWKAKGKEVNDNPSDDIAVKPQPPRETSDYRILALGNPVPLDNYYKLPEERSIETLWTRPKVEKPKPGEGGPKPKERAWADIKIKSVFDPTQSGNYIAIIEIDGRSHIVNEGEQVGAYVIQRIDGVKSCLTIVSRITGKEQTREFCREEESKK